MSIRVSVLGSGSRGNATFIRTDKVRMLIDCGLGPRTLANRLRTIGEDPDQIDVVLITHEHTDHVGVLESMVKKYSLDVFMSGGTMDGSRADSFDMNRSGIVPIVPGQSFTVGDVDIDTVRVPHDTAEPTAFSVRYKGIKVTQLTDLGWIPDHVADWMKESHVLILESNHDLDMLRVGPYPWSLKERLVGRKRPSFQRDRRPLSQGSFRRPGPAYRAGPSQFHEQPPGNRPAGGVSGAVCERSGRGFGLAGFTGHSQYTHRIRLGECRVEVAYLCPQLMAGG